MGDIEPNRLTPSELTKSSGTLLRALFKCLLNMTALQQKKGVWGEILPLVDEQDVFAEPGGSLGEMRANFSLKAVMLLRLWQKSENQVPKHWER